MFNLLFKLFSRPPKVINEGSVLGYFLYERIICPDCSGKGYPSGIGSDYNCGSCKGTGKVVIEVPYFRAEEERR